MAKEIKIYGDIVAYGRKESESDLKSVQAQLANANGEDILVRINSFGGDVEEGFAIYSELRRYAKDNDAKVTTRNDGRCSSIATVIFLAGDVRIASPFIEPFVHNAMMGIDYGNSKDFKEASEELEKCNKMIASHYANHTDLTLDEALELMNGDTYISPEECVSLRFATEVEQIMRPVALQKLNPENHKNNKMNTEKKSWLKNFMNKVLEASKMNKVLHTATSEVLDFPDVDDDGNPQVGDKALLDGKPAVGKYYIPAEDETYIFDEKGILIEKVGSDATVEINNAENVEDPAEGAVTEDVKKLQDRIAELEKELEEKDNYIEELEDAMKTTENKMSEMKSNFKKAQSKINEEPKKESKKNHESAPSKPDLDKAVSNMRNINLKRK